MVLKRSSSAVLKKPSSSTKKVGKGIASVSVGGKRYKIPNWISEEEALHPLKISVTGHGG